MVLCYKSRVFIACAVQSMAVTLVRICDASSCMAWETRMFRYLPERLNNTHNFLLSCKNHLFTHAATEHGPCLDPTVPGV